MDAADSAITKIEGKIASVIKATPDMLVHGDPLTDVSTTLQQSVRKDFLAAGMEELEKYPLDPTKDGPLTLRKPTIFAANLTMTTVHS